MSNLDQGYWGGMQVVVYELRYRCSIYGASAL